jgi:hypothetical protein
MGVENMVIKIDLLIFVPRLVFLLQMGAQYGPVFSVF